SLALLVEASLLTRSFWNLLQEETGLDPSLLATLQLEMGGSGDGSPSVIASRVDDIVARIESVESVESVAASDVVPLRGGGRRATVLFDEGNDSIGTVMV